MGAQPHRGVRDMASSRWNAYLRLGRVSNLPTVWTNGLAGAYFAGGMPDIATAIWIALALSCFYVAGMFLNDAFDWRFDQEFRPERPIPRGEVRIAEVWIAGTVLMAAGIGLSLWIAGRAGAASAPVLIAGLALAGLIVYYNARHKRDPLSPLFMALCRAATYFVAALALGAAVDWRLGLAAAALAAYVIGLTYVAKQENLSEVRNLWPLLFLAGPIALAVANPAAPPLIYLWAALLLGWAVYSISFLVRKQGRSIPRAVVSLIAGISLADALALQAQGAPLEGILACLAGFGLTLLFQRYIPGT